MTKTVSIRIDEDLIDKIKSRAEKRTFNSELVDMLHQFMEFENWGKIEILKMFSEEDLEKITKPAPNMRFVKEAYAMGCDGELREKILSLSSLQCWALYAVL